MKEPQLAFGVASAVFANSVVLVNWFLDDDRPGLDAAGMVGIGVIDGYYRHAGDPAQCAVTGIARRPGAAR